MIIKVPIYVEIDAVQPDLLPDLVEKFARNFTKCLREKNFGKTISKFDSLGKERPVPGYAIITKEIAINTLRTK